MQSDFPPKTVIVDEKSIYRELLEQYKGLPCLWDQTHDMYTNKSVRRQGYEQLLKTYRRGEPSATLNDLKRKLDNMRASYKRERAKVFKARLNGDEHVPMLWYYNLYRFLDEGVDYDPTSPAPRNISVIQKERSDEEGRSDQDRLDETEMLGDDYEVDYLKSEESNPLSNNKQNIIYMTDSAGVHNKSETCEINNDRCLNSETSMEAFGRTVSLQLKELQPLQRFIAEKLISDVIFYGRLGELTREMTFNFKNNDKSVGE